MWWLTVSILSYLFFALAFLGDKIVLVKAPTPKSYTFYVGFFSGLAILAIPFVDFSFPSVSGMSWVVLDAIVYITSLYALFTALEKYDVSRVIPAVGATQPVFVFFLTCLFFGPQFLKQNEILAFLLLLIGSVIICLEKNHAFTKDSLKLSFLTSFLFSMDFVFLKFIFQEQSFWQGFIWIRIISFLIVLLFLLDKKFRNHIFKGKDVKRKTSAIFFLAQGAGGLATMLQSYAIKIVPIAYLAIMNSLKGTQYVFIFLLTLICSFAFPKVLKESISRKVLLQKGLAIVLIFLGLIFLFIP